MPKNIVVFSDGTGQEGGKKNDTNVYKLFNMVEDRTAQQVAFYDRGLGTGWRKLTGNVSGAGISKNIKECYEFVFDNYQSGDQVYLFGFSRGAYTVRSLSGFIEMFGILPRSRPELIKEAYKIYKMNPDKPEKRKAKLDDFLGRHHTMRCAIKFIGVWDTVGALGVPIKALDIVNPFKHKFHNTEMCKNVEIGCHALAIDEKRRAFLPSVWDETKLGKTPDDVPQQIAQVWFAGVHSDVGGGYKEQQISDVVLDWMVKKARAAGLRIYPNHPVTSSPDADGKMHDSQEGIATLYRDAQRSIDKSKIVKTLVHQSVLDRAAKPENNYKPWILDVPHEAVPW